MAALYQAYFDAIDADQDDAISHKELAVFFQSIGTDPKDAQVCFDLFDTDKDGILSRSEFVHMGLEFAFGTDESSQSHKLYGFGF